MPDKPRARSGRAALYGLAILVALLVVAAIGWRWVSIRFPPNSLPWRPVVLNAPPGWIANWQLNNLARHGGDCRAALAASHLDFTALADRKIDDRCGFTNVVRTIASPVTFAPKVTATCALTAALYWWQDQLQPIAQAQMHSALVRVDQLGTYACRNIN